MFDSELAIDAIDKDDSASLSAEDEANQLKSQYPRKEQLPDLVKTLFMAHGFNDLPSLKNKKTKDFTPEEAKQLEQIWRVLDYIKGIKFEVSRLTRLAKHKVGVILAKAGSSESKPEVAKDQIDATHLTEQFLRYCRYVVAWPSGDSGVSPENELTRVCEQFGLPADKVIAYAKGETGNLRISTKIADLLPEQKRELDRLTWIREADDE
jgi:hypothetical protein